jgi:hypothetical protein
MKGLGLAAALSVAAAFLLGVGALSPGWYEAESSQTLRVGLLGAERCDASGCGAVTLDRFGAGPGTRRLGVAAALTGILAALALLAATGIGLKRRRSGGLLPKVALALALFAISAGLAFHLLTPFSEVMSVGLGAFAYFGGAAIAGATAATLLRAIGRPERSA